MALPPTLLALLSAGLLLACHDEPATSEPAARPRNVLLITVDTLRRDRLGYAGASRPLSPNLDALAAGGVRFTHAYSQAGWTLPSIASALTGQTPRVHGATDFDRRIAAGLPTLATLLSAAGYETDAFVTHVLLTERYGLDRGFDRFDTSALGLGRPHRVSTGRHVTDLAIDALERAHAPFLIWVHYFDPHASYLPHEPWSAFGDAPSDRYDQEIAFTDAEIGRLLDALERSGHADDSVVVFLSDHGEEFGEHGGKFHYSLYDEIARIPWVIRAPGLAPRAEARAAQHIDLLPTLLALLGLDAPPGLPGRNLLEPADGTRTLFLDRDRPAGFRQRAVVQGPYKLIHVEEADLDEWAAGARRNASPVEHLHAGTYLYDRSRDPGERTNLMIERRDISRTLVRLLAAHELGRDVGGVPAGSDDASGKVDVDPELREQLEALGYLR